MDTSISLVSRGLVEAASLNTEVPACVTSYEARAQTVNLDQLRKHRQDWWSCRA